QPDPVRRPVVVGAAVARVAPASAPTAAARPAVDVRHLAEAAQVVSQEEIDAAPDLPGDQLAAEEVAYDLDVAGIWCGSSLPRMRVSGLSL
ncbi:MAG: hypothetical protein ACRDHL_09000, partial [Candidatus Promineifilaceae bacterium]